MPPKKTGTRSTTSALEESEEVVTVEVVRRLLDEKESSIKEQYENFATLDTTNKLMAVKVKELLKKQGLVTLDTVRKMLAEQKDLITKQT